MKRDSFSGYHPVISLLYFVLVLGFTMFLSHPVCMAVSMLGALAYSICLKGGAALRFQLCAMLPLMLVTALINPAFSHEGVTVLAYLPSGNPLTLESILYGVFAAGLLVSTLTWFSCFHAVMSSDKFVYLFGRVIPALSLVLSLSLRLVPRFSAQLKRIAGAQRGIGRDAGSGGPIRRARHGIRMLSVLVAWALEHAIDTADSMKSRGYGLPGRTSFAIYRWERRDRAMLTFLLACGAGLLAGTVSGALDFSYYPALSGAEFDGWQCLMLCLDAVLCGLPVFLEGKEALRWKTVRQKPGSNARPW